MNRRGLGLIMLLALGTFGCGDDGPTCPASPVNRYDGYWIGKTNLGTDIQVRVVNNRVVSFEAYLFVSNTCWIGIGHYNPLSAAITDKQFSFVLPVVYTTNTVEVTGSFVGDRALSGTIGSASLPAKACRDSPAMTTQALFFTAEQ